MWQQQKKDNSIVSLPLLLTLATTPWAVTFVGSDLTLAQVSAFTPSSPLTEAVSSRNDAQQDGHSYLVLNSASFVSDSATQTTASNQNSSGNQLIVPSAEQNQTIASEKWLLWLLIPFFALGGVLLWWLQKKRQSPQDKKTQTAEKSTLAQNHIQNQANTEGTDTASGSTVVADSRLLEKIADDTTQDSPSAKNVTVVQPQATAVKVVYPPLPDVWDEVESDMQHSSQATTSISIPQPESQEADSDMQASTVEIPTAESNGTWSTPPEGMDTEDKEDKEVFLSQPTIDDLTQPNEPENFTNAAEENIKVIPNVQPDITEVTASFTERPIDDIALDLEAPVAVVTPVYPMPERMVNTDAVTASVDELPEISKVISDIASDIQPESIEEVTTTSESSSSVIMTPRSPKWAYVAWNISEAEKEPLRQQGGKQLMLRFYDVTDIDPNSQSPQFVQQYDCEETIHNRYIAIPATERDYMVEIGYVTDDMRWLLLARSATVHASNRPDPSQWFVADAELIIHGATEPGSTVSLGGHSIKVKPDGTFHLRIPFTESMINYDIKAITADQEQAKTIHLKFVREAEDNSFNG